LSWVTAANAAIWDPDAGGSWVGFLDKITINNNTIVGSSEDVAAVAQWTLAVNGLTVDEYLWCQNPDNTDFYEATVTWTWTNQDGGSFSGTTGSNLSLGIEERRYICSRASVGQSEGYLTVSIRNILTQQVLVDSAIITLRAIRN
jgi:hypothetical protein